MIRHVGKGTRDKSTPETGLDEGGNRGDGLRLEDDVRLDAVFGAQSRKKLVEDLTGL